MVCLLIAGTGAGDGPAGSPGQSGDFEAAIAQAEDEKTLCHLVRIVAPRLFASMLSPRHTLAALSLLAASPGAAQGLGPLDSSPDQLKRYNDCMALARSEPLKALPAAEKWRRPGVGPGARRC